MTFVKNKCKNDCSGVYFRGVVVMGLQGSPVLALEDASRESKSTGRAVSGAEAILLADKERNSWNKQTLPSSGTLTHSSMSALNGMFV